MHPSSPIALIAGTSSGIGEATCLKFLNAGYTVYGFARRDIPNSLSSPDFDSRYFHSMIDITDFPSVKHLCRSIWSQHKRLDILVNCVGIAHGGLLSSTPIADFERVFNINYFASLQLIQSGVRLLSKTANSSVILVSSSSTIRRDPGSLAYSSSKICLEHSTSLLAREFSPQHVRFNCVAPGVTDTDMLKEMSQPAIMDHLSSSASGRLASVEEIANVIFFLASPSSSHINGQTIRVDGGLS